MAHHEEPMDVDSMDFDKENSFHHSNMLPCTEKGYEELDVSELNMKLRYSVTPASSPMSKSYTASCIENRPTDLSEESLNATITENNLTRSLNSTIKSDLVSKGPKSLPLQTLPTDQYADTSRNKSVLRQLDTSGIVDNNVTVTLSSANCDENLSLPSSSSSALQTPEATTPTKDIPKTDGSPIMRGLKSVLNMFRSSQSPIPPNEDDNIGTKQVLSPVDIYDTLGVEGDKIAVTASTPISAHRNKELGSKRSSPYKDSIVFNDDLEKELQWKDETTIIFSHEKIPIHKLLFQQAKPSPDDEKITAKANEENLNTTVEYMDISCNNSMMDRTMTDVGTNVKIDCSAAVESDSEFLDCETTFTKHEQGNVEDMHSENDTHSISSTTHAEGITMSLPETQVPQNLTIKVSTIHANNTKLLDNSKVSDIMPIAQEMDAINVPNKDATDILNNETDVTILKDNDHIKCFTDELNITPQLALEVVNTKCLDEANTVEQIDVKSTESIEGLSNEANCELDLDSLELNDNKAVTNIPTLNETIPMQTNETLSEAVTDVNKSAMADVHSVSTINDVLNTVSDELPSDVPLPDDDIDNEIDLTHDISTQNLTTNLLENTTNKVLDDTSQIILNHDINTHKLTSTLPENTTNKVLDDTTQIITEVLKNENIEAKYPSEVITEINSEENFKQNESVETNPNMSADSLKLLNDIDNEIDLTINTQNLNSPNMTENAEDKIICDVTQIITPSVTSEVKSANFNKQDESAVSNPDMSVDSIQLLNDIENIVVTNSSIPEYTEMSTQNISQSEGHSEKISHSVFMDENLDEVRALKEILKQNVSIAPETTEIYTSVHIEDKPVFQDIEQKIIPSELTSEKPIIEITNVIDLAVGTLQDKIIELDTSIPPTVIKEPEVKSEPSDNTLLVISSPTATTLETEFTTNLSQAPELPISHVEDSKDEPIDNKAVESVLETNITKLHTECAIPVEQVVDKTMLDVTTISDMIPVSHNSQEVVPETDIIKAEAEFNMSIDTIEEKLNLDEANDTNTDKNNDEAVELCSVQDEPGNITNNLEEIQIAPSETIPIENLNQVLSSLQECVNEGSQKVGDEIKPIEVITADIQENYVKNVTNLNEERVKSDNVEPCDNLNEEKFIMVPDTATPQDKLGTDVIINEQMVGISSENEVKDEEIVVSENTSPFVSMAADINVLPKDEVVNSENTFVSETEIKTIPPSSPPIRSRGYNFNFDEMEDPFATKTKIRLSPPPNTPDKIPADDTGKKNVPRRDFNKKDKRKSFPERKKPTNHKNKLNSTIAESVKDSAKVPHEIVCNEPEIKPEQVENCSETLERSKNESVELDKLEVSEMDEFIANEVKCNENRSIEPENIAPVLSVDVRDSTDVSMTEQMDNKTHDDLKLTPEIKNTSSSEQSTYYSAGASSCESIPSRNVFNLPEIDDINFNPFATKSKMRESPPPCSVKTLSENSIDKHNANTTITFNNHENVEKNFDDKMETEAMEKESSGNLSNATSSSKNTDDINTTVREVNTEDEDTIEGPFLEAEDLENIDKVSDIDCDNAESMQVNNFPTQANDNMPGEMFIDAEAFEFLLNQNQSNIIADSGKESLFLKFDPLFAKRMSTEAFAALGKLKRQSTPTKAKTAQGDVTFDKSPIAGPSNLSATYEGDSNMADASNEDLNITVSKPMMVVTPAVNPAVTPRNKSITPTRQNRHSITFTSPAMAVIDRLLSMSANNSLMGQDTTFTHPTREQHEADIALTQLRELLAEKEINVYNLKTESKELKDRLTTLESHMHMLETESGERLKKINELNNRLSEKTRINRSMAAVVEEYERTIASLIAEIEQDKKRHAEERMQLIKERDEQSAHLSSMEVSFSDLHSKYEKSKQIILSCKAAEDTYKKTIKDSMDNFNKMQNNYELLKQHATSKLNHANTELEKLNRSHEAEVLKLNAMIKRKDLHITSLEETLAQKTKANDELTAICDELINKVG